MTEDIIISEYNALTKEEKIELGYTGKWELDKHRFSKEYTKNIEALTDFITEDFLFEDGE